MTLNTLKRKKFVVVFLLAMTLCNFILAFQLIPKVRNGYQDFTIFYTGALLVRSGHAASLYDLATQFRTQQLFTNVPIRLGPLPFNHPPFEALFFVPFTFLGYWPAYLTWTLLNLIMLAASAFVLKTKVPQFSVVPAEILAIGGVAFFPAAMAMIQGQDVIALLVLFVLAIVMLDRGNDEMAGVLLGFGLFRPQFAVPVVVILAFRRWRILLGFAPVAALLGLVTVWLMGWNGPINYVRFVLRLEATKARAYGPEAVPNLRGLILTIPGISAIGRPAHILVIVSSLLVLFFSLRRVVKGSDSILFVSSLAVVTTILVNFHSLVYDLTLILPTALLLVFATVKGEGTRREIQIALLTALLFLTPLYVFLWLYAESFYLFSLVLIWILIRMLRTPPPAEVPA